MHHADKSARYLSRFWRSLRSWTGDCRGTAAIQFAFILPAFLLLILGTIDVGRVIWTQNALQFASEEAGRYAMTHVSATNPQLVAFTRERLVAFAADDVSVIATNDTVGGVTFVTISLSYDIDLMTPFVSFATISLSGRTRVPLIS